MLSKYLRDGTEPLLVGGLCWISGWSVSCPLTFISGTGAHTPSLTSFHELQYWAHALLVPVF